MTASNDVDHTRIRRLLNHAFSDSALRNQEDIINSYISLFIQKLKPKAESNTPVDIMRYLNFTTFDILGDLCFDESFHALESETYGSWIQGVFQALKMTRMFRVIRSYPVLGIPFFGLLKIAPGMVKARQRHHDHTVHKMDKRINTETDRKDFMRYVSSPKCCSSNETYSRPRSYILKHNDEKGMTRDETIITMSVLIIAGSETSATLLSGAVFYLLKNPSWLHRLQSELAENFHSEEEMSFASLSQLKVMQAILMETSRIYPPTPTMLPRRTYGQGVVVADTYIPQDVTVGIPQFAAYRSSRNFKNADTFAPQRFLDDEEYKDDKRSIIQPFSVGPRNCIGQSMAWAEIRSILARLIWNFDMELQTESSNWADKQKVYILWDKPSLMVKLTAREHV
jgi:cytochrome P450